MSVKTAVQVFQELADYIKGIDIGSRKVPVGIVVSATGQRFIVKYSNSHDIRVFTTYQEAVDFISEWLEIAKDTCV